MKILLFGANGQVGWELQRSLAPVGELTALGREGSNGLSGDLTDPDSLSKTLEKANPDIIVNAAAYTAVDQAETDRETAESANAKAPAILAQHAHRSGAIKRISHHRQTSPKFQTGLQQAAKDFWITSPSLGTGGFKGCKGNIAIRKYISG